MSKTARIKELLTQSDMNASQIGAIVGVHSAYVRTVKQRMAGKDYGLANKRRAHREGDRMTARWEGAVAYRKAKGEGHSVRKATWYYSRAYERAMIRTGRKALQTQRLLAPVEA
jgi:hypothetical protein